MTNLNRNYKYAINEKKQAELDSLSAQISRVQYQVEQLQTVVNSLTQKNTDYETFLADAENNRATALNNLNQVKLVLEGIKEMNRKACLTAQQTFNADQKIKETATQVSILINQLIYSVEIIDKLALLINKKKTSGIIISNDLVSLVTTASADANNAVASTLTALNSCYAAMTSGTEANMVTVLECMQGIKLYELISGDTVGMNNIREAFNTLENALQKAAATDQNLSAVAKAAEDLQTELKQKESDLKKIKTAKNDSEETQEDSSVRHKLESRITEIHALLHQDANSSAQKIEQPPSANNASLQNAIEEFQNAVTAIRYGVIDSKIYNKSSLYFLLDDAYQKAKEKYEAALKASNLAKRELAQADSSLTNATVMLNSLKAGLAAATAAALAA
jgi:hypothetical protein